MFEEIKRHKAAALEAHNTVQRLHDKHGGFDFESWPAEDVSECQAALADTAHHLEQHDAAKKSVDPGQAFHQHAQRFTAPVNANFVDTSKPLEQHGHQVQLAGPTEQEVEQQKAAHRQAFHSYLAHGRDGLSDAQAFNFITSATPAALGGSTAFGSGGPRELHSLTGNVNTLGGFLVPEEFMEELIVETRGLTVVRPMARVRRTSRSSATFMTIASGADPYPSGVTGNFRSEGWVQDGNNPPTQNNPRFGRERVQTHIWAPDLIELTMELMEDSAVNLDTEIRSLLAETKALDEDSAFINGTGVGMPKGVLEEARLGNIRQIKSGIANGQTYAGLVNLFTSVPAQYRGSASWTFNSLTLGLIMALVGSDGQPIFPTNEIPTELFNRPIALSEFVPDGNVDNNLSIIFGDWSWYGIADRMDMRIIRLVERFAPNIALLAIGRLGGQVLKVNPFAVQSVGV